MPRAAITLVLVLAALGAAAVAAEPEPAPVWPLDLDTRYLTGNFMEPRGGRFHTGLDLKTNSRTGYAVLAVRDGWISRIRCSSGGYGKAIYLSTEDGFTYVYGHLGRLADGLREHVRASQRRRGRYAVDLHLDAATFPVRRGEVLALSGQSGTSGPHLHFEVRGSDGRPRDPLAHGFAVPDTMPPEILAVRAVDLRGTGAPTLRWGDGAAPLAGRLPDLFLAHGEVRFTARIVERSDRLRYRLGAWRLRLLLDDREVFSSRNDRLDWRNNRQQRLEYLRTPLGQERWLWRDQRVTLEGRAAPADPGPTPLAPGRHRLRLEAEDRAGNRSAVEWMVEVDPRLPPEAHPGWQESALAYPEPWLLVGEASAGGACPNVTPPVQWRRGDLPQAVPGRWYELAGLEQISAPVQFRTPQAPLLDPVPVRWPPGDAPARAAASDPAVAVYRLHDDAWGYETSVRTEAGEVVFDLDGPGVYALLRDTAAPVIATAPVDTVLERRPPRRAHGIALPRWPVLRIPVGDHGSGVAWESLAVQVDGAPLVAEPDAPRDRILVELPDALAPGRHRLDIAVADRAGHRRQARLTVLLRDPVEP